MRHKIKVARSEEGANSLIEAMAREGFSVKQIAQSNWHDLLYVSILFERTEPINYRDPV